MKLSVWCAFPLICLLAGACSSTPAILDAQGKPLTGSIAVLEEVVLNGRREWISIRGKDQNAPLLLYLAGGPGGSELATARRLFGGLEEQFVVIGWDQPGAGKSYAAVAHRDLTLQVYVDDAEELIDQMRHRFHQEKVLLVGESWGAFLGLMIADQCPEKVAGFVGTGQMVAFLENDLACYNMILDWARSQGDEKKVAELTKQGPPPYQGPGIARKLSAFLMETSRYMREVSHVKSSGIQLADILDQEYNLAEKVQWVPSLMATLDHFYPQLWAYDLRERLPRVEVPVTFLIGRHDVNASIPVFLDYFERLDSPSKEIVWFENSGHTPWAAETDKFVREIVARWGKKKEPGPTT